MIVDALSEYRQPIFVYLPPFAELRGGAWVVLDSAINPEQMEMYADRTARGGVLEAEGVVEVKYREAKILALMQRLDPEYAALKADEKQLAKSGDALAIIDVQAKLHRRQDLLMPVYH